MASIAATPATAHDRVAAARRSELPTGLLVFVPLVMIYGFTLGTTPVRLDEYYTLFAARSWLHDGTFAILDGDYSRARLFTALTGGVFELTGSDTIATGRSIPVVATAVTAAWLFTWMRPHAGLGAALIASLVFGASGWALDIAHFARFYAVQVMLVVIAVTCAFDASTAPRSAVQRLIVAATAFVLAVHVQPTSLIAIAALALWMLPSAARTLVALHLARATPVLLGAGVVLAGVAIAAAPALIGMIAGHLAATPTWAAEHGRDTLFYLREFAVQMPVLLVLFPVAAALAWRRDRRLAGLALLLVVIPVALHSFAGMKAARYIAYCIPFVGIVFGLAFGRSVERGVARLATLLHRSRLPGGMPQISAATLVIATVGIVLAANPTYRHTARAVKLAVASAAHDGGQPPAPRDPLWDARADVLRRLIAPDEFLATADDLRTLAYLRPYDVAINASMLSDIRPAADFAIDPRTGRPIVASARGVAQLLRCHHAGVILADLPHWRVGKGISPGAADVIERNTRRDRAPEGFLLFRWRNPQAQPQSCGIIPDRKRSRA